MKKQLSILVTLVVMCAASCRNDQTASTTATSPSTTRNAATSATANASSLSPEDLGNLGAQIKRQPNDADKLLAQHGLNPQSFAAAIRKVSEDPAAAKRYTAAYKKAS